MFQFLMENEDKMDKRAEPTYEQLTGQQDNSIYDALSEGKSDLIVVDAAATSFDSKVVDDKIWKGRRVPAMTKEQADGLKDKKYKMTIDGSNGYIYLDPIDGQPHQYTMIFLHGLGDGAITFVDWFMNNDLCPKGCRIVLPQSERMYMSHTKMEQAGWFNFFDTSRKRIMPVKEIREMNDQNTIQASADILNQIMDQEKEKLPNKDMGRMFIGGFSQGAAIALASHIQQKGSTPLGGVIGLNGFQILDEDDHILKSLPLVKDTPLFLYHGTADNMIPAENAETTYKFLKT